MPGTCISLPAYPDEGEPCVNGTDLVLVARCISGQRVLVWVFATELSDPPALMEAKPATTCAKVKLLETAERCQWSAEQVQAVAKSLGLK